MNLQTDSLKQAGRFYFVNSTDRVHETKSLLIKSSPLFVACEDSYQFLQDPFSCSFFIHLNILARRGHRAPGQHVHSAPTPELV